MRKKIDNSVPEKSILLNASYQEFSSESFLSFEYFITSSKSGSLYWRYKGIKDSDPIAYEVIIEEGEVYPHVLSTSETGDLTVNDGSFFSTSEDDGVIPAPRFGTTYMRESQIAAGHTKVEISSQPWDRVDGVTQENSGIHTIITQERQTGLTIDGESGVTSSLVTVERLDEDGIVQIKEEVEHLIFQSDGVLLLGAASHIETVRQSVYHAKSDDTLVLVSEQTTTYRKSHHATPEKIILSEQLNGELGTVYHYDATTRLEAVEFSDGSWVYYGSDLDGDVTVHPFGDTPYEDFEPSKSGGDYDDESLAGTVVTRNRQTPDGTISLREEAIFVEDSGWAITSYQGTAFEFGDGVNFDKTRTVRCASIEVGNNESFETIRETFVSHDQGNIDPHYAGRTRQFINEDQTGTRYYYQLGTWESVTSTWQDSSPRQYVDGSWSSVDDWAPSHLRVISVQGVVGVDGEVTGVEGQTTVTVSYQFLGSSSETSEGSELRLFQEGDDLEDGPLLSSRVVLEYEDPHDPEIEMREVFENGRLVSTSLQGDQVSIYTDRSGQVTEYRYNNLGRLESSTFRSLAPGVPSEVTTYEYDGFTTTTTRSWVDSGPTKKIVSSLTSSRTVDLTGRVVSEVNESGRRTDYQYPNRQTRVVLQDGVEISKDISRIDGTPYQSYRAEYQDDGSYELKFVSESARALFDGPGSSPGQAQNGMMITTRSQLGSPTQEVHTDLLGRTRKVTSEGIDTVYLYNEKGQLWSVKRGTLPANLTVYGSLGNVTSQGVDLGGDGVLSADEDNVTTIAQSFVPLDGAYWRQQISTQLASNVQNVSLQLAQFPQDGSDLVSKFYSKDGEGNIVNTVTTLSRETGEQVVQITDSRSTNGYEQRSIQGYPISATSPLADTAQFTQYRIENGNLVTITTDFRGGVSSTVTNQRGQTLSQKNPLNEKTSYTYYSDNLVGSGQLHKTINPMGETVNYTYNLLGQTHRMDGATYPIDYRYDAVGRMISMTTHGQAGASETRWVYDSVSGRLSDKFYSTGPDLGTSYQYDSYGRLKKRLWARKVTEGGDRLYTEYHYNDLGYLEWIDDNEVSNQTPKVTFSNFDLQGRPQLVTEEGRGSVVLSHDPLGRFVSESYSADHDYLSDFSLTREETVTGITRLRKLTLEKSGQEAIFHLVPTTNGRPLAESFRVTRGGETSITQIVASDFYPGSSVPKTKSIKVAGNTVLSHISNLNRAGRVDSIVSRAGGIDGLISTSVGYTYDRAGRRTHATRKDGTTWKYGYNDRGEVTAGEKILAGGEHLAGQQFGYTYDDIGNRTTASFGGDSAGENLSEITYVPNALNQYGTITHPQKTNVVGRAPVDATVVIKESPDGLPLAGLERQGEYFRNEISTTNADGEWKDLYIGLNSANADDHQGGRWIPGELAELEYDADGNLTSDGRWGYRWDANNRLISMESTLEAKAAGHPDFELSFTYDYLGRRVSKTSVNQDNPTETFYQRRFIYDDWNLIAEYQTTDSSGSSLELVAAHHWSNDLSRTPQGAGGVGGLVMSYLKDAEAETWSHLLPSYDGNGNIIAWSDGSGQIVEQRDYDPFGNLLTVHGSLQQSGRSPFGFSTKYEDKESGLLYYGYRYYDPVSGGWINRDPAGEAGGVNLYGMISGGIINALDYLGLTEWTQDTAIAQVKKTVVKWKGLYPFASRLMNYWVTENEKGIHIGKKLLPNYKPTQIDIDEVKKKGGDRIKKIIAHDVFKGSKTPMPRIKATVSGWRLDNDWLPVVHPGLFRAYGGFRLSYASNNPVTSRVDQPFHGFGARIHKLFLSGDFVVSLNDTYTWPSEAAAHFSETYDAAKYLEDNCGYLPFNHYMTFKLRLKDVTDGVGRSGL